MMTSIVLGVVASLWSSSWHLLFALLACRCASSTTTGAFVSQSRPSLNHHCAVKQRQGHDDAATTASLALFSASQKGGGSAARVEQESAASKFSGGGPILAPDMNAYNLALEDVIEQWTASLVAANALQDAGVFLSARNSKEVFVDTLKIVLPRGKTGGGLGIELLELAGYGGSENYGGLGITIASGLVPGGCAEFSGILPGDSISKIAVRRRQTAIKQQETTMETEEVISVDTECLGYDATVDAILSLPPPIQDETTTEEEMVLTIKRLRRKPKVSLTLQYPPSQHNTESDDDGNNIVRLELFAGENLRRAMLARGVKLNDALARRFDSGGSGDCGAEGTCATCAVSVVRGAELLNPPGATESQMVQAVHPRWRLACKAIVGYGMQEGELVIKVNPKQW
jgi:ferredoxin